jgi:indolepyruvate ferredoxin oxidoreductase
MLPVFRMLAKMRRFRGGALDVFGKTAERRQERALVGQYEALVDELLARLAPHDYELAVSLASIPEYIRGYGHVKERHLKDAKAREAALLERLRGTPEAVAKTQVAVAAD